MPSCHFEKIFVNVCGFAPFNKQKSFFLVKLFQQFICVLLCGWSSDDSLWMVFWWKGNFVVHIVVSNNLYNFPQQIYQCNNDLSVMFGPKLPRNCLHWRLRYSIWMSYEMFRPAWPWILTVLDHISYSAIYGEKYSNTALITAVIKDLIILKL